MEAVRGKVTGSGPIAEGRIRSEVLDRYGFDDGDDVEEDWGWDNETSVTGGYFGPRPIGEGTEGEGGSVTKEKKTSGGFMRALKGIGGSKDKEGEASSKEGGSKGAPAAASNDGTASVPPPAPPPAAPKAPKALTAKEVEAAEKAQRKEKQELQVQQQKAAAAAAAAGGGAGGDRR